MDGTCRPWSTLQVKLALRALQQDGADGVQIVVAAASQRPRPRLRHLEQSWHSRWETHTGRVAEKLFMLLPQMHWLPGWLYCLLIVSLISNQGMEYYRVLHWGRILRGFSNDGICSSLASFPCAHGNHQSQAEAPISLFSCLGAHQKWKSQGQHLTASNVVRHQHACGGMVS